MGDQIGPERKCCRYTETVLLLGRTPGVTGTDPGERSWQSRLIGRSVLREP